MSLSLLAAVLAAAFAAVVAARWRRTRRAAFAAWAAGLAVFSVAAAAQAVGEHSGFGPVSFRVFYLFGGVLGVAYLGLGTVHLMAPPAVARAFTVGLLLITAAAAVLVAIVPINEGRLHDSAGVLGDALSGSANIPIRVLAALLNIAGTLALAGGSGWSAYHLWRDRGGVDRVICNVLLTCGALVIAAGLSAGRLAPTAAGGLSTLGGYEAAGIAVMFAGFLCLGRVGAGRAVRSQAGHRGSPATPERVR
jgi:hypothetical protein